jgi:hypothetical protein
MREKGGERDKGYGVLDSRFLTAVSVKKIISFATGFFVATYLT